MKLITQSALAEQLGVSRQAIQGAKREQRIMMDGMTGKKVHLDHELTQQYIESALKGKESRKEDGVPLGQEAKQTNKGRPKKYKKRGKPVPKVDEKPEHPAPVQTVHTETDQDLIIRDVKRATIDMDTPVEKMSKREVELVKLIEQVVALQIKTQVARMELIERALVNRVFAEIYSVDTSELHPLGQKIASELVATVRHLIEKGAGDAEIRLKIQEGIDKHIYRAMEHIKRKMNDFLKKVGDEGRIG